MNSSRSRSNRCKIVSPNNKELKFTRSPTLYEKHHKNKMSARSYSKNKTLSELSFCSNSEKSLSSTVSSLATPPIHAKVITTADGPLKARRFPALKTRNTRRSNSDFASAVYQKIAEKAIVTREEEVFSEAAHSSTQYKNHKDGKQMLSKMVEEKQQQPSILKNKQQLTCLSESNDNENVNLTKGQIAKQNTLTSIDLHLYTDTEETTDMDSVKHASVLHSENKSFKFGKEISTSCIIQQTPLHFSASLGSSSTAVMQKRLKNTNINQMGVQLELPQRRILVKPPTVEHNGRKLKASNNNKNVSNQVSYKLTSTNSTKTTDHDKEEENIVTCAGLLEQSTEKLGSDFKNKGKNTETSSEGTFCLELEISGNSDSRNAIKNTRSLIHETKKTASGQEYEAESTTNSTRVSVRSTRMKSFKGRNNLLAAEKIQKGVSSTVESVTPKINLGSEAETAGNMTSTINFKNQPTALEMQITSNEQHANNSMQSQTCNIDVSEKELNDHSSASEDETDERKSVNGDATVQTDLRNVSLSLARVAGPRRELSQDNNGQNIPHHSRNATPQRLRPETLSEVKVPAFPVNVTKTKINNNMQILNFDENSNENHIKPNVSKNELEESSSSSTMSIKNSNFKPLSSTMIYSGTDRHPTIKSFIAEKQKKNREFSCRSSSTSPEGIVHTSICEELGPVEDRVLLQIIQNATFNTRVANVIPVSSERKFTNSNSSVAAKKCSKKTLKSKILLKTKNACSKRSEVGTVKAVSSALSKGNNSNKQSVLSKNLSKSSEINDFNRIAKISEASKNDLVQSGCDLSSTHSGKGSKHQEISKKLSNLSNQFVKQLKAVQSETVTQGKTMSTHSLSLKKQLKVSGRRCIDLVTLTETSQKNTMQQVEEEYASESKLEQIPVLINAKAGTGHHFCKTATSRRSSSIIPPVSKTNAIFKNFCYMKVSREALGTLNEGAEEFVEQIIRKVMKFAEEDERTTITAEDVIKLFRKKKLINDKTTLQFLVHKYLPIEAASQILPVVLSGNKLMLRK